MPAHQSTITFDVKECAVYSQTSDLSTGASEYGDKTLVRGIQEISLEPNFITNELKGDGGVVLSKKGKVDRLNFSCTYSELAIDVLNILLGSGISTGGTGEAETASLALDDTSLPYFKTAVLIDDLESSGTALATVIITLQKCQLTGGTLVTGSTDTFSTPNFTAEAIKPKGTPVRFGDIAFAETAESLPA